MTSPLKQARLNRELTLQQVADAVDFDTGGLSRIERGQQTPSKRLLEKLVDFFGGEVTEVQILFPERFAADDAGTRGSQDATATGTVDRRPGSGC